MEQTGEPTIRALDYPFDLRPGLDLDPRYTELCQHAPVARVLLPHPDGGEGWLVTSHAETRLVQSDPRFSRTPITDPSTPRFTPQPLPRGIIQAQDPPEHTRLRKLVAGAFTPRRLEQLRSRVSRIVDELLDGLAEHGAPADLVLLFAMPLPLMVICELLGVPYGDRERFRRFSETTLSTTAYTPEQTALATQALQEYLAQLIAARRTAPGDDLLSALVQVRDEGDRLSEQELVMLAIVILVGGEETTATQISNFAYTLLTQPEHFSTLRRDQDRIPQAVEELLRYIPLASTGSLPRVATADVEVSGVTIRAGDVVITHIGTANRDGRVFDEPDRIDFTRQSNPHLAFGHGVHHCLGAALARMELQVALRALISRFPTLRLAVPQADLDWKPGLLLRGPRSLPVAW